MDRRESTYACFGGPEGLDHGLSLACAGSGLALGGSGCVGDPGWLKVYRLKLTCKLLSISIDITSLDLQCHVHACNAV